MSYQYGQYQPAPYQQPQQPVYYQQPQQVTAEDSVGSWMLTQFLVGIPVVGFIYILIVAFGGSTSVSKKNWAIATLIWMAIGIVLSILIVVFMSIAGFSLIGWLSSEYSSPSPTYY